MMRFTSLALICALISAMPICALAGPNDDLIAALAHGDFPAMREAVARGADINLRTNGTPVLTILATGGSTEMARFFLDHGADATAKDNSNDLAAQAIHIAAAVGAVDVVELLIEHGAPVDARDRQNDTPLDFAAMRNQLKMISFLVAKGAGLNTSNAYGRTPLHSAAGSGSKDAVALLLALGADKTAKDIQGKTPYDLAEESTDLSAAGKAAILPLLQTLAASPSDPASSQHGCPHSEEDLQGFYRRAHQRSPTASGLVVYNIVKDELQMMGCPTGQ